MKKFFAFDILLVCYIYLLSNVFLLVLDSFPASTWLCAAVYINHRPVFGLAPLQFQLAFKHLGRREEGGDKDWRISRPKFLSMLQERGESLRCTLQNEACFPKHQVLM